MRSQSYKSSSPFKSTLLSYINIMERKICAIFIIKIMRSDPTQVLEYRSGRGDEFIYRDRQHITTLASEAPTCKLSHKVLGMYLKMGVENGIFSSAPDAMQKNTLSKPRLSGFGLPRREHGAAADICLTFKRREGSGGKENASIIFLREVSVGSEV